MADPMTTRERLDALRRLTDRGVPPGAFLRQGGKQPTNLYLVTAEFPEGLPVGRMDTAELASRVVAAVNAKLASTGWRLEYGIRPVGGTPGMTRFFGSQEEAEAALPGHPGGKLIRRLITLGPVEEEWDDV